MGLAQGQGVPFQFRQARGIFQQVPDPEGQAGGVIRLQGRAVFQQVVGIPFLLAGNGVHQDHGQTHGQAFGRGESARFGHGHVGSGHQAFDGAGKAHGHQPAGMDFGQSVQIREQLLIAAGEGHHLEIAGHGQQAGRGLIQAAAAGARAYSGSAGHQGQYRLVGIQAQAARAFAFIESRRKRGHDWDAGDFDVAPVDSLVGHAPCDFFAGGEISRHMGVDPKAVHVEVRDLYPHGKLEDALADLARQQLRGQKVGADDVIGIEVLEHLHELDGVEPFDGLAERFQLGELARRLVRAAVQVAPDLGIAFDHVKEGIGVHLPEHGRYPFHQIQVDGLDVRIIRFGAGAQGFGGAHMAGSGGNAEDQKGAGGHGKLLFGFMMRAVFGGARPVSAVAPSSQALPSLVRRGLVRPGTRIRRLPSAERSSIVAVRREDPCLRTAGRASLPGYACGRPTGRPSP